MSAIFRKFRKISISYCISYVFNSNDSLATLEITINKFYIIYKTNEAPNCEIVRPEISLPSAARFSKMDF